MTGETGSVPQILVVLCVQRRADWECWESTTSRLSAAADLKETDWRCAVELERRYESENKLLDRKRSLTETPEYMWIWMKDSELLPASTRVLPLLWDINNRVHIGSHCPSKEKFWWILLRLQMKHHQVKMHRFVSEIWTMIVASRDSEFSFLSLCRSLSVASFLSFHLLLLKPQSQTRHLHSSFIFLKKLWILRTFQYSDRLFSSKDASSSLLFVRWHTETHTETSKHWCWLCSLTQQENKFMLTMAFIHLLYFVSQFVYETCFLNTVWSFGCEEFQINILSSPLTWRPSALHLTPPSLRWYFCECQHIRRVQTASINTDRWLAAKDNTAMKRLTFPVQPCVCVCFFFQSSRKNLHLL